MLICLNQQKCTQNEMALSLCSSIENEDMKNVQIFSTAKREIGEFFTKKVLHTFLCYSHAFHFTDTNRFNTFQNSQTAESGNSSRTKKKRHKIQQLDM